MSASSYYVPEQSKWPIITTLALGSFLCGFALMLQVSAGQQASTILPLFMFTIGALGLVYTFFGWFGAVIKESKLGLYSGQMDASFRISMIWFIFTEIMFLLHSSSHFFTYVTSAYLGLLEKVIKP